MCNAYGISHNMIDKAAKNVKNKAVDAKEKGVYGKNCVFDCTYVSRRVADYDDEVRHR